MSLDNLPFNWFDLVIVVVLILGIRRGRKHGMSEELLYLLKWLAIVFVCAYAYKPLGVQIAQSAVFGKLAGYLIAYLGVALLIAAIFALLKKVRGGDKLLSSEVFGRSEFYLGMLAGMVRATCMLVAALALLNARYYNPVEIKADINYQNDVYGTNFFPTLYTVQAQVFDTSLAGPWIKQQLGPLLINPTAPDDKELKQKDFKMP
jgi:uncharacterized membrane protein required for colicin V production